MDRLRCLALLEKVVVEPLGTVANIERIVAMGPESKETYDIPCSVETDEEGADLLGERFRIPAIESGILRKSRISKNLQVYLFYTG